MHFKKEFGGFGRVVRHESGLFWARITILHFFFVLPRTYDGTEPLALWLDDESFVLLGTFSPVR